MDISIVTLEEARRETWDVVVVGTSFAAMFFVHGLPDDLRVLCIEKGALYQHAEWLAGGLSVSESFVQENTSGHEKIWVANTLFGGNSNCWWAQVPRFHPNDFRMRTLYGVGLDWPIGYDRLEPFYMEVEEIMEVAGGGNEHVLPRSRPFPYPPHIPSRTDVRLRKERPDIWFAAPTARSNGGSRARCCANGVCNRCPVDAKFTIVNGLPRMRPGRVSVLFEAEARALGIENGIARTVQVRLRDGQEVEIGATLVALGANAIFNAAILLRSGQQNPALGRYLHEQLGVAITIDVAQDNYFGGTSITGHGYGFYDGPHRSEVGATLLENINSPTALRSDPGRWTQRMKLKLVAEDIPLSENRVELSRDSVPVLFWMGHDPYAKRGLERVIDRLQDAFPFEIERIVGQPTFGSSEAHIQGTHRMGLDPETSVVDRNLRVHGLSNVFALGAGAFPTSSAANPTLTLAALSVMAGRSI